MKKNLGSKYTENKIYTFKNNLIGRISFNSVFNSAHVEEKSLKTARCVYRAGTIESTFSVGETEEAEEEEEESSKEAILSSSYDMPHELEVSLIHRSTA